MPEKETKPGRVLGLSESRKRGIARAMKSVISASRGQVHVISHPRGWAVVQEGANRSYKVCDDKTSAVADAKKLARKKNESSIIVHDITGMPTNVLKI